MVKEVLTLPKVGEVFEIDSKVFRVWDVFTSFNDISQKHVAEISLSSKQISINVVINSTIEFGKR